MDQAGQSDAATHAAEKQNRVNPVVFVGSSAAIVAIALGAIIAPGMAADAIGAVVGWISEGFGWWYFLIATVILAFVVYVAVSRLGKVKLGPEQSRPDDNLFTWVAMLFAAGIGIDLMFFAVSEPVTQYLAPPVGEGETRLPIQPAAVHPVGAVPDLR